MQCHSNADDKLFWLIFHWELIRFVVFLFHLRLLRQLWLHIVMDIIYLNLPITRGSGYTLARYLWSELNCLFMTSADCMTTRQGDFFAVLHSNNWVSDCWMMTLGSGWTTSFLIFAPYLISVHCSDHQHLYCLVCSLLYNYRGAHKHATAQW